MLTLMKASAAAALVLSASHALALGHDIPWRNGASRTVGFGHCAKGPCMKRSSFAASVPHRHTGNGSCEGKGAAGYRFGSRFQC